MDSNPIISATTASQTAAHKLGWLERKLFGSDGFSFRDIVDTLNPLEHIPFVGAKLRAGRDMGAVSTLVGGALLGGATGLALSGARVATKAITGKTPEGWAIAALTNTAEGSAVGGETTTAATDAAASSDRPHHRRIIASAGAMRAYARAAHLVDTPVSG